MIVFLVRRDGAASRSRILASVQADPGVHVSQLAQEAALSWHATIYHLRLLERQGLVQVEKGGRERRAFPTGVPDAHRAWLAAMHLGDAVEVLRALLQDPRQTIPDLSRRMGHSEKVVRRQVANLSHAGLVQRHGQLRPVYEVNRTAEPDLAEWLRRRPTDLATDERGSFDLQEP